MLLLAGALNAQAQQSFLENQKLFPRVGEAFREKEESIKKEFAKKGNRLSRQTDVYPLFQAG